jgi:hypothetical protein
VCACVICICVMHICLCIAAIDKYICLCSNTEENTLFFLWFWGSNPGLSHACVNFTMSNILSYVIKMNGKVKKKKEKMTT